REAALAWQLEQRRSKDWILTAYLNTIYFGNGAYGVQQAAQTYFQHGARKLTLAESALLAGIPSDPSRFDPVRDPAAARARRQVVLGDLLAQGYISQADYQNASSTPLAPTPCLPGRPGAPSGRVGVQAVRARDGARAVDLAADRLRLRAARHLQRRPLLVRPQLRGLLPRADRPDLRDRALGQLRL